MAVEGEQCICSKLSEQISWLHVETTDVCETGTRVHNFGTDDKNGKPSDCLEMLSDRTRVTGICSVLSGPQIWDPANNVCNRGSLHWRHKAVLSARRVPLTARLSSTTRGSTSCLTPHWTYCFVGGIGT